MFSIVQPISLLFHKFLRYIELVNSPSTVPCSCNQDYRLFRHPQWPRRRGKQQSAYVRGPRKYRGRYKLRVAWNHSWDRVTVWYPTSVRLFRDTKQNCSQRTSLRQLPNAKQCYSGDSYEGRSRFRRRSSIAE